MSVASFATGCTRSGPWERLRDRPAVPRFRGNRSVYRRGCGGRKVVMRLVRFVIFIALMALPVHGRAEEGRAGAFGLLRPRAQLDAHMVRARGVTRATARNATRAGASASRSTGSGRNTRRAGQVSAPPRGTRPHAGRPARWPTSWGRPGWLGHQWRKHGVCSGVVGGGLLRPAPGWPMTASSGPDPCWAGSTGRCACPRAVIEEALSRGQPRSWKPDMRDGSPCRAGRVAGGGACA